LIIGLLIPRLRPVTGMIVAFVMIAAFVVMNFSLFQVQHLAESGLSGFDHGNHLSGHYDLSLLQGRAGKEENPGRVSILPDRLGHQ